MAKQKTTDDDQWRRRWERLRAWLREARLAKNTDSMFASDALGMVQETMAAYEKEDKDFGDD